MTFVDPLFLLILLPLILGLFDLAGRLTSRNGALIVLIVASLGLYAPWGVIPLLLLIASMAINFAAAVVLVRLPDVRPRARLLILVAAQAYNFGSLALFKYASFSGWSHDPLSAASVVIPVGISFYTFHQAAFLGDAYQRELTVVALVDRLRLKSVEGAGYAAFVAFFPQLVIGPITLFREVTVQFQRAGFGRIRYRNFAIGFAFLAIGAFKKLVVADGLAPIVDGVFDKAAWHDPIGSSEVLWGVVGYYLQLYFDFSGYSDMALGIARMFGITLPLNFDSPFRATSISDYYRRWHMTLTRVISRFLFTPLSLSGTRFAARHGLTGVTGRLFALWLPLLINFEVIGLWHGALFTFIVFGLVHGLWYAIDSDVRQQQWWKRWRKASEPRIRAVLGHGLFLAIMPLTFALFRADSIETFHYLCRCLFAFDWSGGPLTFGRMVAVRFLAAVGIVYLLPNSAEFLRRYRPALRIYQNISHTPQVLRWAWRPNWGWALVLSGMAGWALIDIARQPPFIYIGF